MSPHFTWVVWVTSWNCWRNTDTPSWWLLFMPQYENVPRTERAERRRRVNDTRVELGVGPRKMWPHFLITVVVLVSRELHISSTTTPTGPTRKRWSYHQVWTWHVISCHTPPSKKLRGIQYTHESWRYFLLFLLIVSYYLNNFSVIIHRREHRFTSKSSNVDSIVYCAIVYYSKKNPFLTSLKTKLQTLRFWFVSLKPFEHTSCRTILSSILERNQLWRVSISPDWIECSQRQDKTTTARSTSSALAHV